MTVKKHLQPIADFLESNDWSENEPEFILLQYDIADKMKEDKIGIESIQPIIELMEKNPLVEFGTPGPLTHFVE